MRPNEITDCERVVMKCVWDNQEDLSMQEITAQVNEKYEKNWKTQTVSTFLSRLVKKDYLKMYRRGRCFYYQPLVDQELYKDSLLLDYIQFWNEGNISSFVCGLMSMDILTSEEKEELKRKIRELE